jgi:AraC-like DNA-binding protein
MTMEKNLQLSQLAGVERIAAQFSRMGDNYMFTRIKGDSVHMSEFDPPMRLDCLSIIVCRKGSLDAEINLQSYHVKANTLLIINPGMLFRLSNIDYTRIDAYILFVSTSFLVDININLNAINIRSLIEKRSPVMRISDSEVTKLMRYFELLDLNARDEESVFSLNIARSVIASLFYQLLQFNFLRISNDTDDENASVRSHRSNYVHDFMRLVHLNYTQHRTVAFYADKLFISPKYLTVLVKEATGRSAADWINEFVIIEAKNLLRFSGKNVQQVAYALSFSNQSSFGKYFKHLTGMSPSEYQKL